MEDGERWGGRREVGRWRGGEWERRDGGGGGEEGGESGEGWEEEVGRSGPDMTLTTMCLSRSPQKLWRPCPCGHDPLPCTCVQAPKNNLSLCHWRTSVNRNSASESAFTSRRKSVEIAKATAYWRKNCIHCGAVEIRVLLRQHGYRTKHCQSNWRMNSIHWRAK